MKNTGTLDVTTPSDREIRMTRVFDASRDLVWQALTTPAMMKRWLGPRGHQLIVCESDLRVGGNYRWVFRDPRGAEMGMRGEVRELEAPHRMVTTESMDGFPGESVVTLTLAERAGKTTMTLIAQYDTREVRDFVVKAGMEHGAAESYDRLAEILRGDSTLVITRELDAPRDLAFEAWTKPEYLDQWYGPDGFTATWKVDFRPGGAHELRMRGHGMDHTVRGEYVEIERPDKIVMTFRFADLPEHTITTTVTFSEFEGKTTVTVVQLFPLLDQLSAAEQAVLRPRVKGAPIGWDQTLTNLATFVAKRR